MRLIKLELKNYKAHKHFVAEFNGKNCVVSGSKGSGKTSLKDAFTWLMTGSMVDDPTPVNNLGEVIDHLTISVEATFDNDVTLKIEDSQRWVKDVLKSRHNSTYFINNTPLLEKDYQAYLDNNIGTIEQRKILTDPSWFAYGDGLKVVGKTSKTATQRRREIVISVASVEELEHAIADNEEKAKQAKFAISTLKKDLEDAYAGIESLHNAKVDVSDINKEFILRTIKELETDKISTIKGIQQIEAGDDNHNALQRAFSNAQTELSTTRAKYMQEYTKLVEQAEKPLRDYTNLKQSLERDLENEKYEVNRRANLDRQLINEIEELEKERADLVEKYNLEKATEFVPNSSICPTCKQLLPVDNLRESEARFNKHKSDELERIVAKGNEVKSLLEKKKAEINLSKPASKIAELEKKLNELVEPKVETPIPFEMTEKYMSLAQAIIEAEQALEANSKDDVKRLYERTLESIDVQIQSYQNQLKGFETNQHLENEIDKKGLELQGISNELDEQKGLLEKCNEFTRTTLANLEKTLEDKFDGIRFKMFEYTLDGTQKDTCITYAKTENGFIPWESLSGGQKRSATIKLANAFSKAWEVEVPLWIDDTQIYNDDELDAIMQLIRITEVPHQKLEVK